MSRFKSRLPNHGISCISVYLVPPTSLGHSVGFCSPILVMSIHSTRNFGSIKAPAGLIRSAAACASKRMLVYSGLLAWASSSRVGRLAPGSASPASTPAGTAMATSAAIAPARNTCCIGLLCVGIDQRLVNECLQLLKAKGGQRLAVDKVFGRHGDVHGFRVGQVLRNRAGNFR